MGEAEPEDHEEQRRVLIVNEPQSGSLQAVSALLRPKEPRRPEGGEGGV